MPVSPAVSVPRKQREHLFLSYGRKDAGPLAERLRADLEEEGFTVWIDTREIRGGKDWEEEVRTGLRGAEVVVAVLSPHAVRTAGPGRSDESDGVCLDEISYARFEHPRKVVPVMAVKCEPPLCIFRLDYIDLTRWEEKDRYCAGFRRLVEGVDAALRGEMQYRIWYPHLQPLDFGPYLNDKRKDFTGRQWLFEEIDSWRRNKRERALLITGGPGAGKSALVAQLIHRNPVGRCSPITAARPTVGKRC